MKILLLLVTLIPFISHQKVKPKPSKSSPICEYEQKMRDQGLVNIQEIDSDILVELKYSTTDNFVGKDVYGCIINCYLQKNPAEMLSIASDLLQRKNPNYRLLVYDGGRPLSIQKILWNSLTQYSPKERATYVANPTQGSIHNYGSAVDLTIANADGTPLDMGTKYDFFGELAYPKKESYFLKIGKLTKQQIANRQLLRSVMQSAGYMPIEYEWWHFNAVSRQTAKATYRIIQ
jgi:zinc D-Ala-D-Ala dipeptidase